MATKSDLKCRVWRLHYEAHRRFVRYRCALAYARNRLTTAQAQSMVHDIESASGWHHLISLDEEYVMEEALERWRPHPGLRDLVAEACDYVASKYEEHSEVVYAKGWALDRVEDYAKSQDIILELTDDFADLEDTTPPDGWVSKEGQTFDAATGRWAATGEANG